MEKKTPIRTCIACRQAKDKRELIRIVRNGDVIKVDRTGKMNGRGAYVCDNEECMQKIVKNKLLNRAFSQNVSDQIYASLMEEFLDK